MTGQGWLIALGLSGVLWGLIYGAGVAVAHFV